MKPYIFLITFSFFLYACNNTSGYESTDGKEAAPKTLEPFADSLVRLDKFSLESIETAAGYFQRLVPADSALADSAAAMFLRHVSGVVDTTNQKTFQDTTDYSELVYNESTNVPDAQKRFKQNLERNHVILQADGEGGVYAVADYSWINNILQPKTSAAVDAYLSLIAKEEKTPTLVDAALAVEASELADRLVTAESLLKQRLPKSFAEDIASRNKFYTATLLFGSDNGPAMEFDTIALVEEFKIGYNYLAEKYPSSQAAQLVKEWQAIVAAKDSKKIEQWRMKYSPYYD